MNDDKLSTASVEALVFDQQFKQAVLGPSGDSSGYISRMLAKNPGLEPIVAEARRIVLSLHHHYNKQGQRLSEEDRKKIWKHIHDNDKY